MSKQVKVNIDGGMEAAMAELREQFAKANAKAITELLAEVSGIDTAMGVAREKLEAYLKLAREERNAKLATITALGGTVPEPVKPSPSIKINGAGAVKMSDILRALNSQKAIRVRIAESKSHGSPWQLMGIEKSAFEALPE